MSSMANKNNRQNQAACSDIRGDFESALRTFYLDGREKAEIEFKKSEELLAQYFRCDGGSWSSLRKYAHEVQQAMCSPCICWYCSLPVSKRDLARELVDIKAKHLDMEYGESLKNRIGACAEVVFGMHFGLEINMNQGFDGGKDFAIPCNRAASGELTIDVKGTTVGVPGVSIGDVRFQYQYDWKSKSNHIYVLLQALGVHVFFKGFAFGNDEAMEQISWVEERPVEWMAPRPDRSIEELVALMENRTGAPFCEDIIERPCPVIDETEPDFEQQQVNQAFTSPNAATAKAMRAADSKQGKRVRNSAEAFNVLGI